jgi:hypothetical protein
MNVLWTLHEFGETDQRLPGLFEGWVVDFK